MVMGGWGGVERALCGVVVWGDGAGKRDGREVERV